MTTAPAGTPNGQLSEVHPGEVLRIRPCFWTDNGAQAIATRPGVVIEDNRSGTGRTLRLRALFVGAEANTGWLGAKKQYPEGPQKSLRHGTGV